MTLVLAVAFYTDTAISHPFLQFWWLPLLAGFWFSMTRINRSSTAPLLPKIIVTIGSGLSGLAFILLFNDTATAFLFFSWLLVALAGWFYTYPTRDNERKSMLVVSLVAALALLLLPVGVNRVTLQLPSLSGQTHFSLHQETGGSPISSAHYYQRIANHEEQIIHLASQYYPPGSKNAPLLEIRDDQEDVGFVIQDVFYEHVLGLFKLSLYKIGEANMSSLVLDPASDPVTFSYPENGGTRIEDVRIGDQVWIALPGIPADAIGPKETTIVLLVRILFWLLIGLTVTLWRPIRAISEEHS
jgi:hypothetical protein